MSFQKIKKHLKELGAYCSGKRISGNKENAILKIENQLGESLPRDYREMLLGLDTPLLFRKDVAYKPIKPSPWHADGIGEILMFFGLHGKNGLMDTLETYDGRIPGSLFAVGESPGGNLLCLGIRGQELDKMYFWDHEDEREITGNVRNDFGNLYLVANSFESFVIGLFPHEYEVCPEELDDIEVTLDAELEAAIEKFKKKKRKKK